MTDSYELAAFIDYWLASRRSLVEDATPIPAEPVAPAIVWTSKPTHTPGVPAFTHLQTEACLDVSEALLEARINSRSDDPQAAAFARFWEDRGTVEMRLTITPQIADWALAVIRVDDADAWSGFAYDWEVIPRSPPTSTGTAMRLPSIPIMRRSLPACWPC